MAVNSEKNYYINPKALSFTPNYQGYRNIVYVSIVSNAAIKAYHNDIDGLGYGMDAEYQTWRLSGTTTALGTASAYFIYARLSRTQHVADIIFSVRDYNVEGGYSYTDSEGNSQTVEKSDEYFYIKIGSLTATDAAGDDATVNRVLTYVSGELGTDKQINEKSDSVFEQMFEFVSSGVEKLINVKQPFKSITVAGESLFKGLVTFVKGFVLGDREINAIATSEDDYNEDTNDSTLPTTGYVQKEIEALDDHFLIKDDADTEQSVAGPVTFEKDVTVEGDQSVGGNQTINGTQEVKGVQTLHQGFKTPNFFQQGDIIQGAQVDADGNAAFTSITAPVMQIYELQYNRKTAVQEEFIFSDGDTIETVTYIQADGTEIDSADYDGEEYSYIRLGVRKQYEGYMTTFKDEDILYSNVNIIGESGKPATTGKCWMRVLALNNDLGVDPISSDGLFINALLYSTSQCPAGVNMAPTPHMIISRHGNAGIDEDGNAKYPERQSVFIISTASENMVMLRGISAPIIPQTGAYAIVSGKLPKSLFDKVHSYASYISKDDPVSYARYGIFENMIQLDHEGSPIKTERYRGVWSEDIAKGDEDNRYRSKYATDITYYDTVSYEGSKWACEDDKTTEAPSDSSTKWTKIVSKGDKGDSVTGSTIQYAINQSMTDKPDEIEFDDDYPTVINEGDVLWTRTRVNFDNATIKTEWAYSASRQGKNGLDNSSVTFELQPNVTTIYIHDEDNLSTESINLTVRKATSKGVEIIDNNADLLADGFKLQYTYDGILDDREDLILNPETILLEDGSEMLLEDDSAAELEFTVEDILNVKNYIEFYLVNVDTNEIWATCTVAVVHDGESLTSLIVTPKTIFVNVGVSGDKNGKIIDPTKEHTIVFQIKKGDKPQLLSNYTIKVSAGGLNLNIKDEDSYTKSFVISCRNGSSIPPTHTITATKGSLTITEEVTIHPVQQGLVGSSGKLYYSMGYWDETTAAEGYYVNDDKRICYIYHVDSFYERTDNPLKTYKDEDGNTRYYTPNKEVEYFGSNGGWAVMPKYSAIIADFIMANFARFGSPNGGVFYSNLLFSAMGLDKDGNQVPYDKYSDSMFVGDDENGYRLSGSVTPNLFLDFLTGFAKFNRINEPFIQANRDVDSNIFQLTTSDNSGRYYTRGLNVSVPYSSNNGAIFMPYGGDIISPTGNALYDLEWDTDGTSSTIIVQSSNEYIGVRFDGNNRAVIWDTIAQYVTVLFSDGRYMDYRSYRSKVNSNNAKYVEFNPQEEAMEVVGSGAIQHGSHFIVGGVPTQVLFLLPGDIVKMKSCVGAFGETDWYVENSDGFGIINATIEISPSYALSTDGAKVEVTDYISLGGRMSPILYGDAGEPIFGSKSVMDLYNESDNKGLIEMTVYVEENLIS